ncbi:MAG: molybdopterin-dependent oxidoreductase, partial [Paracoccaceae bacterium]
MEELGREYLTSTHWGTYEVKVSNGRVVALDPFSEDEDPSPIGPGIVDVMDGPTRITSPMIRKSWLENGPGSNTNKRGSEEFVKVSWEKTIQLVANELNRVKSNFGNHTIYAGSYGWASAGRFHHAQSQLKRFLNCIGGYTGSVNTYSYAAAEVVVPHILGSFREHIDSSTSWNSIIDNCELFVALGGIPLKNGQISAGGTGKHVQRNGLFSAYEAGIEFVNVSPLKSDIEHKIQADWIAIRPSTDTAFLLSLAHTLIIKNLVDIDFINKYTVGFEQFSEYLFGKQDGIPKSAKWGADICNIPEKKIIDLASAMARKKTMISVSWSLTRQDHGEQPFWAAIALASMLGQIGKPGTGLGFGYSAMNHIGLNRRQMRYPSLPQGVNKVKSFIPVARISELLENPGGSFNYNGREHIFPDTKIVWWAGGNPFHHHQDLNRLIKAWS